MSNKLGALAASSRLTIAKAWTLGRLGGLTTATLGISFVLQWYLVSHFGSGATTDAYFAAIIVPHLLFDVLCRTMAYVLVPNLASLDSEERRRAAWSLLQIVGGVFVGLTVLLTLTANYWTRVVFPGFDKAAGDLVTQLVQICLWNAVFQSMSSVATAHLRARERFVSPEIAGVVSAVGSLGFMVVLLPAWGIAAAAWAWLLRGALELILVLPTMGRFSAIAWTPPVRSTIRSVGPLLGGACIYRTDLLLDRFLTSMAPPGSLTLLALARQLHHAYARIVSQTLIVPMVPRLSRAWSAGDRGAFSQMIRRRVLATLSIAAISMAGLVLFGQQILQMLFSRMALGPGELYSLWLMMVLLAGILLFDPLTQVLNNVYFVRGDTATPTRVRIVTHLLGFALRIGCFFAFGAAGIALGVSVYYCLFTALLAASIRGGWRPMSHAINKEGQGDAHRRAA